MSVLLFIFLCMAVGSGIATVALAPFQRSPFIAGLSGQLLGEVFVSAIAIAVPVTVGLALAARSLDGAIGGWTFVAAEAAKPFILGAVAFAILLLFADLSMDHGVWIGLAMFITAAMISACRLLSIILRSIDFPTVLCFILQIIYSFFFVIVIFLYCGIPVEPNPLVWEPVALGAATATAGLIYLVVDKTDRQIHLNRSFRIASYSFIYLFSSISTCVSLVYFLNSPGSFGSLLSSIDHLTFFDEPGSGENSRIIMFEDEYLFRSQYNQGIDIRAYSEQDFEIIVENRIYSQDGPNPLFEDLSFRASAGQWVSIVVRASNRDQGVDRPFSLLWQPNGTPESMTHLAFWQLPRDPLTRAIDELFYDGDYRGASSVWQEILETGDFLRVMMSSDVDQEEINSIDRFEKMIDEFNDDRSFLAESGGNLGQSRYLFGIIMEDVEVTAAMGDLLMPEIQNNDGPTRPVGSIAGSDIVGSVSGSISAGSIVLFDSEQQVIRVLGGRSRNPPRIGITMDGWDSAVHWIGSEMLVGDDTRRMIDDALVWVRRKADEEFFGDFSVSRGLDYLRDRMPSLARIHALRLPPDELEPGRDALILHEGQSFVEGRVRIIERRAQDRLIVVPLRAWVLEEQYNNSPCFLVPESMITQLPAEQSDMLEAALAEWESEGNLGRPDIRNVDAADVELSGCVDPRSRPPRIIFSQDGNELGLYELDLKENVAISLGSSGVDDFTVGLTYDPLRNELIGSRWDPLLRIAPDGSGYEELGTEGAEGLALDTESNILYASHNDQFYSINPDTGEVIENLEAPWNDANCLAFDRFTRRVYALADRGLFAYDVDVKTWERIGDFPTRAQFCGLAFDPSRHRLLAGGFDDQPSILWEIDPNSGTRSIIQLFDLELFGGLTVIAN